MNVVFSTFLKQELLHAESRYAEISERLGAEFHERVKEALRVIIKWNGGDHVGPHGFPCRRCRPLFKSHDEVPLFDVASRGSSVAVFDAFVSELKARIRAANAKSASK